MAELNTPDSNEATSIYRSAAFDNRRASATCVGPHYAFEHGGQRFAYAYLRKNACSAFKNLICTTSPWTSAMKSRDKPLRFLREYHPVNSVEHALEADVRLFVYRDPVDRAVSLFKNKFIMRTGNNDIFADYVRVTGEDPVDASFDTFVHDYLATGVGMLDPHCRGQQAQLLPIVYTHAIDMDRLAVELRDLLGDELVDRFFARPVNSSASTTYDRSCGDVDNATLHAVFTTDRTMPSRDALLTNDTRAALECIYAADIRMLASVRGAASEAKAA